MDIKKEFRDFSVKHLGNNGLVTDQYMGMFNPTNLTPYITEERRLNVAQMDVFSRLMMDRIIFLGTGIDDQVANIVTAQLFTSIRLEEVFMRDWEFMTRCRLSNQM